VVQQQQQKQSHSSQQQSLQPRYVRGEFLKPPAAKSRAKKSKQIEEEAQQHLNQRHSSI
jgi:hypothetical protein